MTGDGYRDGLRAPEARRRETVIRRLVGGPNYDVDFLAGSIPAENMPWDLRQLAGGRAARLVR